MRFNSLCIAFALLAVGGCGQRDMVPLVGKVTLDGNPLKTGVVTFHNLKNGPSGFGQIGPDGGYAARTGSLDGLRPGDYAITVSAFEAPEPATGFVEKMPQALTPARYASPETSGLNCSVRQSSGVYDIQLTTKQ